MSYLLDMERSRGFEKPERGKPYELEQIHELDRGTHMTPNVERVPASAQWRDLAARAGRNEKPALLVTAVGGGLLEDPRELRTALEDTWTTCEWPGLAASRELWTALFSMATPADTYLHEVEPRPVRSLPESLHVYRAAAPGHEDGMSWTTSFERAHWFATRLGALGGRPHGIVEMDVPREFVLALFHRTRQEHEVVVDTEQCPAGLSRPVERSRWDELVVADMAGSSGQD
ncbi:hypothetical protein ACTJI8_10105 [Microbacterium sp. 22303]|uniref:hypothetical protein n=1 Tax=Microbacterium sp. 22303 TaxID=3453905 RepID=UPI003F831A08